MYTRFILCLPLFLIACTPPAPPSSHLAQYLENAELQCETEEQKENIHQAFRDMLTLSPEELKGKLYKNYQGIPEWQAHVVLEKHFVPDSQMFLDKDTFYEDLKDPRAQKNIQQWLKKMERKPTVKASKL